MDRDDYADNEDEDDETQENEVFEATKEQTVFLIDSGPMMHTTFAMHEEEGPVTHTYFTYTMKLVMKHLKSKIFQNPNDEFAVLFYSTRTSDNASNVENVCTYLKMDLTDASRIKQIQEFTAEDFNDKIGSLEGGPLLKPEALKMGLLAARELLVSRTKSKKTVLLITCDDDPCGAAAAGSKSGVVERARQLRHSSISFQFLPLPTPGRLFDISHIWREMLRASRGEEEDDEDQESVDSEYSYLRDMSRHEVLTSEHISECMESMDRLVRKKAYKRRAAARLRWRLVEGSEIAVQVYNLVLPCAAPTYTNIHAVTNTMLRQERRLINADTGAMVHDQDKVTVFQAGPKVTPDRFPPNVRVSNDVLSAVKSVMEPGLKLMGFKPRSYLRDYHQAGHSSFLRPNETEVKGSVTAFKAILDAMVREDSVAICSYRRSKSSYARHVALLPQLELRDSFNFQIFPEGMHVFHLPFSDDIRCPEADSSVVGPDIHRASRQQVDAAAMMMSALSFGRDEHTGQSRFACEMVPNPALQRAYMAIECRAMGKEIPPLALEDDGTAPDMTSIEGKHDLIQAYMDAVYGEGANIDGAKGAKRAAPGAQRATAAAGAAEAYLGFDWTELCGRPAALEKLTIPNLKIYLQYHRQPVSGNKSELCARIRRHMGVDF